MGNLNHKSHERSGVRVFDNTTEAAFVCDIQVGGVLISFHRRDSVPSTSDPPTTLNSKGFDESLD